MADEEINNGTNENENENEEQINPYLEPLEEMIQTLSEKIESLQLLENQEIINWNRNVDWYWKWEANQNEPGSEPEPNPPEPEPEPEPQEDLPMDIIVSRNEVIKIIRQIKKEFIERDKSKKIQETATPITQEEWAEWEVEEERKYNCLQQVENSVKALDTATLTEEWILCSNSLPPLSYLYYLTTNENGVLGLNYINNNQEWSSEIPIKAWMSAPNPYEE